MSASRRGYKFTMWWSGKVTDVEKDCCTVQFEDGSYVTDTMAVVARFSVTNTLWRTGRHWVETSAAYV